MPRAAVSSSIKVAIRKELLASGNTAPRADLKKKYGVSAAVIQEQVEVVRYILEEEIPGDRLHDRHTPPNQLPELEIASVSLQYIFITNRMLKY